jgi:hypothetical protein
MASVESPASLEVALVVGKAGRDDPSEVLSAFEFHAPSLVVDGGCPVLFDFSAHLLAVIVHIVDTGD